MTEQDAKDTQAGALARKALGEAVAAFPGGVPTPVLLCGDPYEPPVPEVGHWIEIVMVDGTDRPMPGVRYEITASDGQTYAGTLDDTGSARVIGIAPGDAMIAFPDLDRRTWDPA